VELLLQEYHPKPDVLHREDALKKKCNFGMPFSRKAIARNIQMSDESVFGKMFIFDISCLSICKYRESVNPRHTLSTCPAASSIQVPGMSGNARMRTFTITPHQADKTP
jgi:hypothetical protein